MLTFYTYRKSHGFIVRRSWSFIASLFRLVVIEIVINIININIIINVSITISDSISLLLLLFCHRLILVLTSWKNRL